MSKETPLTALELSLEMDRLLAELAANNEQLRREIELLQQEANRNGE